MYSHLRIFFQHYHFFLEAFTFSEFCPSRIIFWTTVGRLEEIFKHYSFLQVHLPPFHPNLMGEKVKEVKMFVFWCFSILVLNIFFRKCFNWKVINQKSKFTLPPPSLLERGQNMHWFQRNLRILNTCSTESMYEISDFREFWQGLGDFWGEKPILNRTSALSKLKNEASSIQKWTKPFTKVKICYFIKN